MQAEETRAGRGARLVSVLPSGGGRGQAEEGGPVTAAGRARERRRQVPQRGEEGCAQARRRGRPLRARARSLGGRGRSQAGARKPEAGRGWRQGEAGQAGGRPLPPPRQPRPPGAGGRAEAGAGERGEGLNRVSVHR